MRARFFRAGSIGAGFLAVLAVSAVMTGCASADYSGEESEEQEILYIFEEWADSIREADTDWYVSLYHEEAVKLRFTAYGETIEYRGTDAIADHMDPVFEEMGEALLSYNPPEWEFGFDPVTDTPWIVMRDGEGRVSEVLRFVNDYGDWYIGEQWVFDTRFPEAEAGEFSGWADGNRDGILDPGEQGELFRAARGLLTEPGKADHPLREHFDWDADGYYSEWEIEIARYVLFHGRMMHLPGQFSGFVRERLDWDGDGRVSVHEANVLVHQQFGEHPYLPGVVREPSDSLRDFNRDGFVSPVELEAYRDQAFRVALLNPVPLLYNRENPALTENIRRWADQNGNGSLDGLELETVAFTLIDTMEGDVPALSPVHRYFDRNRNGIVEAQEGDWGRRDLVLRYLPAARERRIMVFNNITDREMEFRDTPFGRRDFSGDFLESFDRESLGQRYADLPRPVESELDELWDFNGDGRLDSDEMFTLRRMVAHAVTVVWMEDDSERADVFAVHSVLDQTADINGDGRLFSRERRDMAAALAGPGPASSPFARAIDSDGSGAVGVDELAYAKETGFIPVDGGGEAAAALTSSTYRPEKNGTETGPVKRTTLKGERLAVLGVRDLTEKMKQAETDLMVAFLENAFVNYGNATVVDRQNLEKIMEEHRYQVSALVDEETAVEIGKLTGADAIAIGSVSRLGTLYYLHLKLIDVETGAILGSSISQGESEADFLAMCNGAVSPLF